MVSNSEPIVDVCKNRGRGTDLAQHHNAESGWDWPDIEDYVRDSSVPLHPPIEDAVRAAPGLQL